VDSGVTRVLCAPGNAGTAAFAENVGVAATDIEALVALAKDRDVGLVVVGPEARIGRGTRVRRSVILEGGDVPDGTTLEGVILSPEGKVQVGS